MGIAGWMDFLDDHPIQNKAITMLKASIRVFIFFTSGIGLTYPGAPKHASGRRRYSSCSTHA